MSNQEKLSELSDEQIHVLAKASDKLLVGGDILSTTIALLMILILVVVLLKLLGKEVIVK